MEMRKDTHPNDVLAWIGIVPPFAERGRIQLEQRAVAHRKRDVPAETRERTGVLGEAQPGDVQPAQIGVRDDLGPHALQHRELRVEVGGEERLRLRVCVRAGERGERGLPCRLVEVDGHALDVVHAAYDVLYASSLASEEVVEPVEVLRRDVLGFKTDEERYLRSVFFLQTMRLIEKGCKLRLKRAESDVFLARMNFN